MMLTIAEILKDSVAMNEAVLCKDFDEARFRAHSVMAKADAAGLVQAALDAARVVAQLGPLGSAPQASCTGAILTLANTLTNLAFMPQTSGGW